jgi:hypothetical protein
MRSVLISRGNSILEMLVQEVLQSLCARDKALPQTS